MIQVIQQGLLDTIQDNGRYGFQHLGINPGGAMDRVAMFVANSLVNNDVNEALIEMHFPASAYLFENGALIALAGADFGAMMNDQPINILQPIYMPAQSILRFTKPVHGARCYMAVAGGLILDPWLGSYSTHLKAGAGGYDGRRLQKQDHLATRRIYKGDFKILPFSADIRGLYTDNIKVLPGSDWTPALLSSHFMLSEQSDRMGFRLKGDTLPVVHGPERLSAGVTRGTIQLLPGGELIILMADHQTTGGYGRVAHVISADQPSLAQWSPQLPLKFEQVDQEIALQLLHDQQLHLQILRNACILEYEQYGCELA
jgi:antagonist of KipI